ncbi:hypothetical protein BOX15_Mlig029434g1 [Macrostomum lignano]|uniref:ceramide glucosyltransferase n=1 Tax=Macrostomum lignano TaxID=282301 RepID=A0A267FJV1_9PLAT|nr:hypothetical protein BOX15_Mlig029434g1 [Macrostomum lignano]
MLHSSYLHYAQLAAALFVVAMLAVLLTAYILAIIWARVYFYRRVNFSPDMLEAGLPGVSIIKPLVGIDRNVYANLETFFTLQYPKYELLFCLESDSDSARMVIETLMEKYPAVEARLLCSPILCGVNPKINNMMQGYQTAKHQLVLISDSGVKMRPEALADMVWCINQKDVGLVHQMPFVDQRPGFRSLVHSAYFGCSHAKSYISANCLGITCCTGMSCLFRRQVVDELPSGLAYFGRYLAEDFFLAQHIQSRGYRVSVSHYPALQDGTGEVRFLQRRLIRWAQLRTAMVPHIILLELIAECLAAGLLGAWALPFLFPSLNPCACFLIHCLTWLLADYAMLRSCMDTAGVDEKPQFGRVEFVCAWLLCVGMTPLNLLVSLSRSEIVWRNRRFRLSWGGATHEVSSQQKLTNASSKPTL